MFSANLLHVIAIRWGNLGKGASECRPPVALPDLHGLSKLFRAFYLAQFLTVLPLIVSLNVAANADPHSSFNLSAPSQGWILTSLCQDRAGRLWVGTEDRGVVWYDAAGESWKQACAPGNFDDISVYSLACDPRGELWAGTLNHGIAGFDGQRWNYESEINGLRGRHVVGLTIDPVDGALWAATESGISRRDITTCAWTYFPLIVKGAIVVPTCLAFDKSGTLYIGTQCDGLLVGSRADGYSKWQDITGPTLMPDHPQGPGLACSMINCMLIAANGALWLGTPSGLSCSADQGKTWTHYCGLDWPNKQALLPDATPESGKLASKEFLGDTFKLSEDYVTCLAEMPAGHLWIGHRARSCDELNLTTLKLEQSGTADNNHTVYAIAMLPVGHRVVVATYGNGLMDFSSNGVTAEHTASPIDENINSANSDDSNIAPNKFKPAPRTMRDQLATLRNIPASADEYKPFVTPLTDDWVTEGNWLGRYGGYWAVLAATVAPNDYVWGAAPHGVEYCVQMGPHHTDGDSLRYWVEWLYTDQRRVMELPGPYLQSRILRNATTADMNRRESEWDDHAEAYDRCWSGLNVYITIAVPPGLFRLSTYHLDKDGHTQLYNVSRDYRVSIRQHPSDVDLSDISSFQSMPELAHGRITNFCGGVWKRFAVRGPIDLTIEINKNYSTNTIICGVTLDLLDGNPPPYYQTFAQYEKHQEVRADQWKAEIAHETRYGGPAAEETTDKSIADQILDELDRLKFSNTIWWCVNKDEYYPGLVRYYAEQARSAKHTKAKAMATQAALAKCYYDCAIYDKSETSLKDIGITTARQIEKSLMWDGVSSDGDGYKVVSDYLEARRTKTPGGNGSER